MKRPESVTLGIDPSLVATGVALVHYTEDEIILLDGATFTLSSAKDLSVYWIAEQIYKVVEHMVDSLGKTVTHWGIETPIYGPNPHTLIRQSCLIGSLATRIQTKYGVYPWEINPAQTKASLGLRPGSKKKEVVERVRNMVPTFDQRYTNLDRKVVVEAIADAIGVAQATRILN